MSKRVVFIILNILILVSCNNKHKTNSLEIETLSSSDEVDSLDSLVDNDCVFDTSTYKFTTEALIHFDRNILFSWNDSIKEAKTILKNGDTLFLSIGGCNHFGYSARLITQIPFDQQDSLLNKTRWIAKSFFKDGFDNYDKYIQDGLYSMDDMSDSTMFRYNILLPKDVAENQFFDGFSFEKQPHNTEITINGYFN